MATQYHTKLRSDAHLLGDVGQRLTQRRIALDMTQAELAKAAGVGKRTLERMEAGGSTQLTNFIRVLRQLELLDDFLSALPDGSPGPMEMLRSKGKPRQRVRHSNKDHNLLRDGKWTWADEDEDKT